jgi:hypothetical protein
MAPVTDGPFRVSWGADDPLTGNGNDMTVDEHGNVVELTVDTPHGRVTLPVAQAMTVAWCLRDFRRQGHLNACGCCVAVHDPADGSCGWLIGSDGGREWLDHVEPPA